jgi:tRNA 2-thiocytidine biosynthesis protein TtcA
MPDPSAAQRLERRLSRALARAVTGFQMLRDNDHVMVAVSGGKDSVTLLQLLHRLRARAPVRFSLVAVHLDQGQPGHDPSPLAAWCEQQGYRLHVVCDDTYSIVRDKIPEGATACSLCSRLRRAVLYRVALELGCTRIALGHHRDDAVVTLLMNLMFSGQLKSMPPKLVSDDGRNVVIRPLIYCAESDIAQYATLMGFPILPCNICGSQPDHQRKVVGALLQQLEAGNPGVRASMLAALANVRPSHLLDPGLWKKLDLQVAREDDRPSEVIDPEQLVRP